MSTSASTIHFLSSPIHGSFNKKDILSNEGSLAQRKPKKTNEIASKNISNDHGYTRPKEIADKPFEITISDYTFKPNSLRVPVGSSIVFKFIPKSGMQEHVIVGFCSKSGAPLMRSPMLSSNGLREFTQTFSTPLEIDLNCEVFSDMRGHLTVFAPKPMDELLLGDIEVKVGNSDCLACICPSQIEINPIQRVVIKWCGGGAHHIVVSPLPGIPSPLREKKFVLDGIRKMKEAIALSVQRKVQYTISCTDHPSSMTVVTVGGTNNVNEYAVSESESSQISSFADTDDDMHSEKWPIDTSLLASDIRRQRSEAKEGTNIIKSDVDDHMDLELGLRTTSTESAFKSYKNKVNATDSGDAEHEDNSSKKKKKRRKPKKNESEENREISIVPSVKLLPRVLVVAGANGLKPKHINIQKGQPVCLVLGKREADADIRRVICIDSKNKSSALHDSFSYRLTLADASEKPLMLDYEGDYVLTDLATGKRCTVSVSTESGNHTLESQANEAMDLLLKEEEASLAKKQKEKEKKVKPKKSVLPGTKKDGLHVSDEWDWPSETASASSATYADIKIENVNPSENPSEQALTTPNVASTTLKSVVALKDFGRVSMYADCCIARVSIGEKRINSGTTPPRVNVGWVPDEGALLNCSLDLIDTNNLNVPYNIRVFKVMRPGDLIRGEGEARLTISLFGPRSCTFILLDPGLFRVIDEVTGNITEVEAFVLDFIPEIGNKWEYLESNKPLKNATTFGGKKIVSSETRVPGGEIELDNDKAKLKMEKDDWAMALALQEEEKLAVEAEQAARQKETDEDWVVSSKSNKKRPSNQRVINPNNVDRKNNQISYLRMPSGPADNSVVKFKMFHKGSPKIHAHLDTRNSKNTLNRVKASEYNVSPRSQKTSSSPKKIHAPIPQSPVLLPSTNAIDTQIILPYIPKIVPDETQQEIEIKTLPICPPEEVIIDEVVVNHSLSQVVKHVNKIENSSQSIVFGDFSEASEESLVEDTFNTASTVSSPEIGPVSLNFASVDMETPSAQDLGKELLSMLQRSPTCTAAVGGDRDNKNAANCRDNKPDNEHLTFLQNRWEEFEKRVAIGFDLLPDGTQAPILFLRSRYGT